MLTSLAFSTRGSGSCNLRSPVKPAAIGTRHDVTSDLCGEPVQLVAKHHARSGVRQPLDFELLVEPLLHPRIDVSREEPSVELLETHNHAAFDDHEEDTCSHVVHYGVSKRAVVNVATQERWQEQVAELERKARQATNEKALETLEEMNERHLKLLKVVQAKALEALRQYPLKTATAAVRALDSSIRQERVVRGEPSDRTATSVEETIRSE